MKFLYHQKGDENDDECEESLQLEGHQVDDNFMLEVDKCGNEIDKNSNNESIDDVVPMNGDEENGCELESNEGADTEDMRVVEEKSGNGEDASEVAIVHKKVLGINSHEDANESDGLKSTLIPEATTQRHVSGDINVGSNKVPSWNPDEPTSGSPCVHQRRESMHGALFLTIDSLIQWISVHRRK